MAKIYNKKEIVYYVDCDKHNDRAIDELRNDLYDTYDDVAIYHNGLHENRIVCTQLI